MVILGIRLLAQILIVPPSNFFFLEGVIYIHKYICSTENRLYIRTGLKKTVQRTGWVARHPERAPVLVFMVSDGPGLPMAWVGPTVRVGYVTGW
jgi:hypothetical protein